MKLQFTQPDKNVHSYVSTGTDGSVEGYVVSGDRKTKKWTTTFNGEPVGEPQDSRAAANQVAQEHAFPGSTQTPAPSSGEDKRPVAKINSREHAVLTAVKGLAPAPAELLNIAEVTKFDTATVMSAFANMGRRGYLKVDGLSATITENGEKVYADYVAPTSTAGPRRVAQDPITEEARREAREKRIREKENFIEGEQDYLLEPISDIELEESRLRLAQANVEHAKAVHRKYPFSKAADAKMATALENVKRLEENIELMKAGKPRPTQSRGKDVEGEAEGEVAAEAPAAE